MCIVINSSVCVCVCMYVCRYSVKLLRNDSDWLANSGETQTLVVGSAAVMTAVIESNETSVS